MIPDVSREALLGAMARFDREVRDDPSGAAWEDDARYKYAIEHEGRRYPVKKILSMATGGPVSSFSGGPEANNYLERRGFTGVPSNDEGTHILQIHLKPKRLMKCLIAIAVLLSIFSLTGVCYRHFGGRERYLVRMFDLDSEWNIPTVYSSFILLLSSVLVAIIAANKRRLGDRLVTHWLVLSVLLFVMSLDELLGFHEMLNEPIRSFLGVTGIFYYGFVIPGIMFFIVLVLCYRRFVLELQKRTRYLLCLSAVLYGCGVIVLESIGGLIVSQRGTGNTLYRIVTNIEEMFELSGVLVFIYAVTSYASLYVNLLVIQIKDGLKSLEG